MRLLPSPSISSSSNASFDANLCTPKSATASCLTGILHRFLCSRSLPIYHDQTTETSSVICDTSNHRAVLKSKEIPEASVSNAPGLVARLMGLKSVPARVPVDQKMREDSVSRSQSLNSVELRGEGDQMQGKYRTVPIFLEIESKDFLVLGFEDTAGKSKRSRRRKAGRCKMGTGELEEKRRERCKRKKNRTESVLQSEKKVEEEKINEMVLRVLNEAELRNRITVENSVNEVDNEDLPNIRPCLKDACKKSIALQDGEKGRWTELKQVQNGLQLVRKKTKKVNYCELENEEPECSSSQDSSPVSVFDFGQFVMDPEPGVTTSEEDTNSGPYCSRRTLSMELQNHDHLLQRSDDHLLIDDDKTEQMRGKSRGKACHDSLEYSNTWSEICRLVETHLQESNLLHRMSSKPEDLEDICRDFGMRILDELLEELVDQICLTCHEHF